MPLIAEQGSSAYPAAMASAFFRLLALAAVLLMPAGMASAPAMAQPAPAAVGHCDEHQEPVDAPLKAQAHCTACAALPAFDPPEAAETPRLRAPRVLARIDSVSEIVPEIATPPPKPF